MSLSLPEKKGSTPRTHTQCMTEDSKHRAKAVAEGTASASLKGNTCVSVGYIEIEPEFVVV
jgi:hypothetical protein